MYYGKKYGHDKLLFFKNADIFVFPTNYPNECFPLVLLEAMEYALPCISTNEGGINDIIDSKTGFVINKNDTNALADKIEWLFINNTERISKGLAGRQRFKEEFTLSQFEKRMTNIFKNIL